MVSHETSSQDPGPAVLCPTYRDQKQRMLGACLELNWKAKSALLSLEAEPDASFFPFCIVRILWNYNFSAAANAICELFLPVENVTIAEALFVV